MSQKFAGIYSFISKNKTLFIFIAIFVSFLFLRFYDIEGKNLFGWDQVDSAWASKAIIEDHNYPLVGTAAKLNSGINIGPLYYYLIAVFYKIYNLDPIASGVFAGITSIFTFLTFFYIIRKLFSIQIALVASFIYTFSYFFIYSDRVQWVVDFIPSVSLIIFYCLYKALIGKIKFLIPLAVALGFSFSIHSTSIFYILIIFAVIPLFPRNKQFLKYLLISVVLFLIFLLPNIISEFSKKSSSSRNIFNYVSVYYHGFHLRRFFQLINDAFIEFESIFYFKILKPLKFVLIPVFLFIYLKKYSKEKIIFCYLVVLWFLIPWIVFTTYSGEITNYYFSLTTPLALMIISYLTFKIFAINNLVPRLIIIVFWIYYSFMNINSYLNYNESSSIKNHRTYVKDVIGNGGSVKFHEGSADYYFYYLYKLRK